MFDLISLEAECLGPLSHRRNCKRMAGPGTNQRRKQLGDASQAFRVDWRIWDVSEVGKLATISTPGVASTLRFGSCL